MGQNNTLKRVLNFGMRDLKDILKYEQWRNFLKVVEKAKESCNNAKNDIGEHFADVSKMVRIGSEGYRKMVFV
jgi:DNA-damage-inducible protein D